MTSLKLSQGAKPGIGGVLPGAKVTQEIAEARGVPQGQKCVSPSYHRVFSTPRELVLFMARMRELTDGKPAGFKLCLGSRADFLGICKAMVAEGVTPDFVIVDGGEGGTGAAPLEYEDHIGTPLTEGLLTVHNCLVGVGLRDQVRIGASGKVASGIDVVKRLVQGADYTNAARAMMMAVGCIQAQTCHTNTCPVGVATQDRRRAAGAGRAGQDRAGLPLPGAVRAAGHAGDGLAWASRGPRTSARTCCAAGSGTTRSRRTPRCSTTSSPASCCASPRTAGGPGTGRWPTPTGSPSERRPP